MVKSGDWLYFKLAPKTAVAMKGKLNRDREGGRRGREVEEWGLRRRW
jgi:hypothetical protein